MTEAVPSHGTILAMEQNPSGSPGVFLDIAEIIEIGSPSTSRESVETTPHNATVSQHVAAGRLLHGEMQLGINYLHEHATHSAAAGLKKAMYDNETRGFRFRGPGGTTDTDEIIFSGKVLNFQPSNPNRSGQRQATVTIQPSGVFKDDGTSIGSVGA